MRDEWRDLELSEVYCSCGNPDPLNEDHVESCPMTLPQDVLEEVESCTSP